MTNQGKLLLKLGIAVGLLTLAFGAFETASSNDSPQKTSLTNTEAIDAKATISLTPHITDRAGYRTISIYHTTNNQGKMDITSSREIDVTSITLSNGLYTSGVDNSGGMVFLDDDERGFFYMAIKEYGTQHITLNSPMLLRDGDSVNLVPQYTNLAEWDITIHGRIPATSGMMLK